MPRKKTQQVNIKAIAYLILFACIIHMAQDRTGQVYLSMIGVGIGLCIGTYFFITKIYIPGKKRQRLLSLRMWEVDEMAGTQFEQFIATLMQSQGYRTTLTPARNDFGVDIVAERDGIRYAIQCKRRGENLSRDCVSDAVAGKQHYKCNVAMVVTNRHFRSGAQALAASTQCVLIDRDRLMEWMEVNQKLSVKAQKPIEVTPAELS